MGSSCLSVRMFRLQYYLLDFDELWYWLGLPPLKVIEGLNFCLEHPNITSNFGT
jgi:hypothetical protein